MLKHFPVSHLEPSKVSWVLLVCIVLGNFSCIERSVDIADPLVGTAGKGHTFPGATVPFGMVQLSPATGFGAGKRHAAYDYADRFIKGFAHTHLGGSESEGLGDILLMPTVGEATVRPGTADDPEGGYGSAFSHHREEARPGYYRVWLDRYGIEAEFTTTERVGVHRYTFPDTTEANIIIDPTHHLQGQIYETRINLVSDREIRGFKYARGEGGDRYVFFVASFSQPFARSEIILKDSIEAITSDERGRNVKAFASFVARHDNPIEVKVAISYVSYRGALRNLEEEADGKDFRQIAREAENHWSALLNKIDVKAPAKDKKIFYTSLYHTALAPNTFSDVDGRYRVQGRVKRSADLPQYSSFSTWNTFRSVHPLFNLITPETNASLVNSMVSRHWQAGSGLPGLETTGRDNGRISGANAVPIIADAVLKDLPQIDGEAALKAMVHAANYDRKSHPVYPHHGLNYYTTIGYIPAKFNYSVSKALEYAYQDWCIYKAAEKVGDQKTAAKFWSRSKTFVNYFNESRSFFWPKTLEGKWVDLSPENGEALYTHYAAGEIHGYSAFMPHAVRNLEFLLGGKEAFIAWLDRIFTEEVDSLPGCIGNYRHVEGPSHHLPYLYVFAGQPWKTQRIIRRILADFYTEEPDGLTGPDRSGQLSAWYAFNALGFYPFCPGDDKYILGSPSVDEAVIHLSDSTELSIKVRHNSSKNVYVQSVELNGRKLLRSFLYHREIMAGGELVFRMGPKPNREWATAESYLPDFSAIDKHHRLRGPLHFTTLPPHTWRGKQVFHDKQVVRLRSNTPGATIRYTLSGRRPRRSDPVYKGGIELDKTTRIRARAFSDSMPPSPVFDRTFYRSITTRRNQRVRLLADGETDRRLLDGQLASSDPLDNAWFRSNKKDLKFVLDLGSSEPVRSVTIHYLVHSSKGISAPGTVRVKGGPKSDQLLFLGRQSSRFQGQNKENFIGVYRLRFRPYRCRFLEISIDNPAIDSTSDREEEGQGVMIDEIVVDTF